MQTATVLAMTALAVACGDSESPDDTATQNPPAVNPDPNDEVPVDDDLTIVVEETLPSVATVEIDENVSIEEPSSVEPPSEDPVSSDPISVVTAPPTVDPVTVDPVTVESLAQCSDFSTSTTCKNATDVDCEWDTSKKDCVKEGTVSFDCSEKDVSENECGDEKTCDWDSSESECATKDDSNSNSEPGASECYDNDNKNDYYKCIAEDECFWQNNKCTGWDTCSDFDDDYDGYFTCRDTISDCSVKNYKSTTDFECVGSKDSSASDPECSKESTSSECGKASDCDWDSGDSSSGDSKCEEESSNGNSDTSSPESNSNDYCFEQTTEGNCDNLHGCSWHDELDFCTPWNDDNGIDCEDRQTQNKCDYQSPAREVCDWVGNTCERISCDDHNESNCRTSAYCYWDAAETTSSDRCKEVTSCGALDDGAGTESEKRIMCATTMSCVWDDGSKECKDFTKCEDIDDSGVCDGGNSPYKETCVWHDKECKPTGCNLLNSNECQENRTCYYDGSTGKCENFDECKDMDNYTSYCNSQVNCYPDPESGNDCKEIDNCSDINFKNNQTSVCTNQTECYVESGGLDDGCENAYN